MQPGALRALEFDRIVEAISRLALTPLGRARLSALRPSTDARTVSAAQAATSDGVAYLNENPAFPLEAPPTLEALLTSLAVEGRPLEAQALVGLSMFLGSIEATRTAVRSARQPLLLLRAIVDRAASFEREVAEVRQKIDASGELADEASPELRTIRERLRKQRARLRGMLESFLRSKDTARYLQEQIVTDRNGRYVLVVRAEHHAAIPGIVHGSSASGASLYLEPLSTVDINNEIVALEQQETEEARRILLQLTDGFRRRAFDLQRTIEAATDLDVIQARARFAQMVDGVEPALAADGRLELRAARHPLLIPAVRALLDERPGTCLATDAAPRETALDAFAGAGPVPVDLLLVPPTQVLVITGPNTGGKTVALKAAGLLALMAQAGLHLPAAGGTEVPIFRSVFADIGDEQSITASLSTFSWHVTNMASMDRALTLPALVLLDEIGAGTDPIEGGALGMAVIDHFRHRGALVVATTHYDALKSYASTTEGARCAAFGFDPETFAPTYQLAYGSPGRSLAFEIATRLGLSSSIVEAARHYRSEREAQLAEHLAKIERDINALEHERRLVARERATIAEETARLRAREQELRDRETALRRRLDERLDGRVRDARREIDGVVEELRQKAAEMAADAARRRTEPGLGLSTGDAGMLRSSARAAVEAVVDRYREAADGPTAAEGVASSAAAVHGPPATGARVVMAGLGLDGVVTAVFAREAEVDVRGKRVRVPFGELRAAPDEPCRARSERPRVSVNVELQPREAPATDLNVIGCTVDEAVSRAERFLDDAMLTEQQTVRVIHGYGTGQLRRALAVFLSAHPLVARISAAPADQGGGGVTVVELKE